MTHAETVQREYYAKTAAKYDAMHVPADQKDEHYLALSVMTGLMRFYGCSSVLDVGAGTGRTLTWLKEAGLGLRATGVEPVSEMRSVGHQKGLGLHELIAGDATRLQFEDGAFDVVCCFGVLHHVPRPDLVVAEMLRVARRMIFISDANNFGQGGGIARAVKQMVNALGLWPMVNFLKTRGRGYSTSEGDGLFYSYSVFNSYRAIRSACDTVHLFNTTDSASLNLYRGAPLMVIAGVKTPAAGQGVSLA